ncbi:hypothetical protein ABT294_46540 [Nonomuraea sp. NPDC000554]|uniref:hypothetical protein n=1 Tax=Nonomuraea sp. NPDC000554 TaxID=3154259 RepID=UPI00332D2890
MTETVRRRVLMIAGVLAGTVMLALAAALIGGVSTGRSLSPLPLPSSETVADRHARPAAITSVPARSRIPASQEAHTQAPSPARHAEPVPGRPSRTASPTPARTPGPSATPGATPGTTPRVAPSLEPGTPPGRAARRLRAPDTPIQVLSPTDPAYPRPHKTRHRARTSAGTATIR